MNEIAYGNKYDRNLSTVEIAKLVRTEIKAAVKAGRLPKVKYSVRSAYFSGGSSIDVKAMVPFNVLRDEEGQMEARSVGHRKPWLTHEAYDSETQLSNMLDAYNFDGSDRISDYYHVNFYGSVTIKEEVAK